MRTRSAFSVAIAVGFSLWGCSDEVAGPGVGPDTSWQVFCGENDPDMNCGSSEQPHGPLGGTNANSKDDDYKFEVSCSKASGGLTIRVEDPGSEANTRTKIPTRPRSILEITKAKPGSNQCIVALSEYPNSGGQRLLSDTCEGTTAATGNPGTCTLEGEEDTDNGYAFEGTLFCTGMRIRGQGPAVYALYKARSEGDPIELQIANCK